MKTSEQLNEIAPALAKAQSQMLPAEKNAINPHFKSSYSNLTAVFDAIREPLSSNGLAIMQEATSNNSGVSVTTRLLHVSGQWIEFEPLIIPVGKATPHAVGSAISYAKRYAVSAALGIVAHEDDDANSANQSAKFKSSTITNDQYVALSDLLNKVPEYKAQVIKTMQRDFQTSDLSQLPANLFQAVMSNAQTAFARSKEVVTCA